MTDRDLTAERLRQTFELFEFGIAMVAARLRREHPDATSTEIDRLVDEWMAVRPRFR